MKKDKITLENLVEFINTGFENVNKRLEEVNRKFSVNDERMNDITITMQKVFISDDKRINLLGKEVSILSDTMRKGLEDIENRLNTFGDRIDLVDGRTGLISDNLINIKEYIEKRFDKVNDRFIDMEKSVEDLALMTKNGFDSMTDEFIKANSKLYHNEVGVDKIVDELMAVNSELSGLRSKQIDQAEDITELQSDVKGFKIEWPHIAYKQDLVKLEKKLTAGK